MLSWNYGSSVDFLQWHQGQFLVQTVVYATLVSVNSSCLSFSRPLFLNFVHLNFLSFLIGGASTSHVQASLRLLSYMLLNWLIRLSDRYSFSFSSEVFNIGARTFLSIASSHIVYFYLYASNSGFDFCNLLLDLQHFCMVLNLFPTYWAAASSSAIFTLSSTPLSLEELELLEPFDSELLLEWMLLQLLLLL